MFGFKHGRLGSAGNRTIIQRAIASLRARGTDAHLWLPGGDVRTYGAELVVNGGFDSADLTLWPVTPVADGSAAVVGGEMQVTATSEYGGRMYTISDLSTSKQYLISATTRSVSGGSSPFIGVATSSLGSAAVQLIMTSSATTSPITQNAVFTPAASTLYLCCRDNTNTVGVVNGFDNISVREITSITPTITSGLTTGNYLESTGNSIATVDNPVGLVLDALGSVGAELSGTGDFSTGWVGVNASGWSLSGGSVVGVAATGYLTNSSIATTVGKTYLVTLTASARSAGQIDPYFEGALPTFYGMCTTVGVSRRIVTVTSGPGIALQLIGNSFTGSLDNISVREVSGIHLTQSTTANKAIVQRGLWNLLTYSSDFSNAAWVKTNVSVTPLQTGPSGASDATLISDTSTSGAHQFFVYYTPSYVHTVTMAAVVKYSGKNIVGFGGNWDYLEVQIDLQTGTVSGSGAASVTVVSVGNGYWLIARNSTLPDTIPRVYMCTTSYEGAALGDGILAQKFALFQGTLTASEILAAGGIPVTTTAAGSNPDSGRYAWKFDGSNDSLALGSVPFQMGDDHCVIAGLAPASNVSDGYAFNPASGAGTQMVGCLLVTSAGYAKAAWWDDTTLIAITDNVGRANTSFVASAVKVVNAKRLRVNGTQSEATETTPMGTTTVIGGSIGAYSPTGGNKYLGQTGPVLAIKGTVTDSELLMYERLIAALTPGAPTF